MTRLDKIYHLRIKGYQVVIDIHGKILVRRFENWYIFTSVNQAHKYFFHW